MVIAKVWHCTRSYDETQGDVEQYLTKTMIRKGYIDPPVVTRAVFHAAIIVYRTIVPDTLAHVCSYTSSIPQSIWMTNPFSLPASLPPAVRKGELEAFCSKPCVIEVITYISFPFFARCPFGPIPTSDVHLASTLASALLSISRSYRRTGWMPNALSWDRNWEVWCWSKVACLVRFDDRRRGNIRETKGLIVGSDAQRIPTLTSMFDHNAESALSPGLGQHCSTEFRIKTYLWCRSKLIRCRANAIARYWRDKHCKCQSTDKIWILTTHNPPSAKMMNNPVFCLRGSISDDSTGIGSAIIIMSVRILKAALKNQRNLRSIQRPGVSRLQNAWIGTQLQMAVIIAWIKYAMTIPRTIRHEILTLGPTNTRMYWKIIDIFVAHIEML